MEQVGVGVGWGVVVGGRQLVECYLGVVGHPGLMAIGLLHRAANVRKRDVDSEVLAKSDIGESTRHR